MINQYILSDLLVITFSLSSVLGLSILFLIILVNRLWTLKRENLKMKDSIGKKTEEILEEASKKANQIIEEAILKAASFEKSAVVEHQWLEMLLKKEIEEVVQKHSSQLEQVLARARLENINLMKNVSENIQKDTEGQISQFKGLVLRSTVDFQKEVDRKVQEAYQLLLDEIAQYRAQRLSQVDENVFEILEDVTEKVLGESLSFSKHEELIFNSLEKAKKEGVFKK